MEVTEHSEGADELASPSEKKHPLIIKENSSYDFVFIGLTDEYPASVWPGTIHKCVYKALPLSLQSLTRLFAY